LVGGTGLPVTTAVTVDDDAVEATTFDAVTTTRTVDPTSDPASVYVLEVAKAMSTHPTPD
jgi:hypothetical protein